MKVAVILRMIVPNHFLTYLSHLGGAKVCKILIPVVKQNPKQLTTSPCDFMLLHRECKPYTDGENTAFSGVVISLVSKQPSGPL